MTDGPARPDPPDLDSFRLIVESVEDYAIFMLSPEGVVRTWNAGAERIKGYDASEVVGRHFSIFYPPSEIRSGKPDYELRAAAERGRFEDEGWRLRKDGSRFWANVVLTALRDRETGALLGFAKVTRDLSDRRRLELERKVLLDAERASREQAESASERLEAVQQIIDASIEHPDLPGLLRSLSTSVTDVLHADMVAVYLLEGDTLVAREVVGLNGDGFVGAQVVVPADVARDPERVVELVRARTPASLGSAHCVPLLVRDHVLGVLQLGNRQLRQFTLDDRLLLDLVADRMALSIDRARVVEAEQQIRAEMLAAQASARLRDEFLAVAAHELKTPLAGLNAAAQLAQRRARQEPVDERGAVLVDAVVRQAERLTRLVNQLLDASNMEMGRFTLALATVDVAPLVDAVVQAARDLSARDIRVEVETRPTYALLDPLRFEQVLGNFIDNAIQYCPPESGPIEVTLREEPEWVCVQVRDHGPGIEEGLREGLFERFYRAQPNSYRSGLGLGLFIAREIVQAHRGLIGAEFPPHGGSLFFARFPRTPADAPLS